MASSKPSPAPVSIPNYMKFVFGGSAGYAIHVKYFNDLNSYRPYRERGRKTFPPSSPC